MIGDIIEIERAKRQVYEDLPVVADAPSVVGDMPAGEGPAHLGADKTAPAGESRLAGWLDALKHKWRVPPGRIST